VRRAVGAAVVPMDGLVVLAKRARARRHDLVDAQDELVEDGLVVVLRRTRALILQMQNKSSSAFTTLTCSH
jgi:hypothetical protein